MELLTGKHQKSLHCNLFLLLLISNYFYFKSCEKFGSSSYLMYWGRDACGIVSHWVIFDVLTAVSVKRADVLVVTPCALIEIYHPFLFYHEGRGGGFLHFYGLNRARCFSKTFVSFYQTSYLTERWNSWKMRNFNRCSAACNLFTFNGWIGKCGPIKCTFFSSKREITHRGKLKRTVLSCNRNLAFSKPYTKTEFHQAIMEHWIWLTLLLIGRKL